MHAASSCIVRIVRHAARIGYTEPGIFARRCNRWAGTVELQDESYASHCPELSPMFVLVWYTLGVLIPAGVGAVLGPWLLRW